ncbi:hypothetical protein DNAM_190 [Pseudomonas phage BroderSalsa]|nr:hypothetical protein DNAM_190 [Pseudomonas phage BroderSalsa]
MIYLIDKSNLRLLDRCVTGLERALTKTPLGLSWDIPSLYESVSSSHARVFYQEESGYSGVFTIHEAPLMRSLYWWWSGKDPENRVPIDFAEVDSLLVQVAQIFNCSQILGEGRKGWDRVGGPLGYTEDSRLYTKKVPT